MRYKFMLCFIGISNLIFSQINYNKSTWTIKGNATSLFDIFTFPTVQLSIEKILTNHLSLSSEAGYQFYDFRRTDTTFLDPKGFKVNFECRYYFYKLFNTRISKNSAKLYTGLRPFYRQNQYTASIPYQTKFDPVNWKDDDFGVKNNSYGLYYIFGFQQSLSDRLLFDFHGGVGVIKRTIKNIELQYNKDSGDILGGTDLIQFFETFHLNESSGLWGSFLFGIRIGYRL